MEPNGRRESAPQNDTGMPMPGIVQNSIPLETYIQRATQSAGTATTTTTNERVKTGHKSPLLVRNRVNRILLFNGCFNPPHHGHLAHLTHAFRHCGEDLNVVGAVILVAPDSYLRWKHKAGTDVLRLSETQRIQLWNEELAGSHAGTHNAGDGDGDEDYGWFWVIPETMWSQIVQVIEQSSRIEGFPVEFVRLAGGDKVSLQAAEHGVWGCRMTLTTDISRPVDFLPELSSEPMSLKHHSPWKRVGWDKLEGTQELETKLAPVEREIIQHISTSSSLPPPKNASHSKRGVWVCERESARGGDRRYTLHFVTSTPAERLSPDLSSTNVRQIIADFYNSSNGTSSIQELETRLRGVALSPGLLARFVAEEKEAEETEGQPPSKRIRSSYDEDIDVDEDMNDYDDIDEDWYS
ncbi:hypothetical protein F4677DRAFT_422866 [Hypoxylon crocopeplum]|nr:hypothetical protein F4677DRAFT_422866 [Hypoxylon crocopeplum]